MPPRKKKPDPDKLNPFERSGKQPYQTLKIPLKTILCNKEALPVLTQIVFDMNEIVIHTYQFIRFYLLYLYKNNIDFPNIDDTFILYCMKTLGTRDNRGKKSVNTDLLEQLDTFYTNEYQPLVNHEKVSLLNKTYLLPYLATHIYTAFSNNITERFTTHLLRFINVTTSHITEDKAILFQFKNRLFNLEVENDLKFIEWKNTHLSHILPTTPIKKSIHYDVKVRPFSYLKGMLYMNSVLEENERKLFQPIPLRTDIIPKYITLDTACLVSLFCPEKNKDGTKSKKGELLKHIKDNQVDIWSSFINLDNKIFKNKHYQFSYQLQTDGVGCSLLFIRKDLVENKKWGSKIDIVEEKEYPYLESLDDSELTKLKSKKIIGCDPGKRSLVYIVDEEGTKLQYTAPQKRIESKAKRNAYVLGIEKRRFGITEKETLLSSCNGNTSNYEKFKSYLVEKTKLNNETSLFYQKEVWRKMKFRAYSYGKKSLDVFLHKIKETFGDNLLIGYGNWSHDTQMKNFMPTMNKGLRKLIHKKYDTITVNECMTSKNCCDCLSTLENYKNTKGKKIHRLLVCKGVECVRSQNKKAVFKTRDLNSAINILNLTKKWIEKKERPEEFKSKYRSSPSESEDKVEP
jgi:hypothetical protein